MEQYQDDTAINLAVLMLVSTNTSINVYDAYNAVENLSAWDVAVYARVRNPSVEHPYSHIEAMRFLSI